MPPLLTHVLVSVAVADLRKKPSHSSELLTQALMGEPLDVTGRTTDRKWLKVRRWDAHRGWVRTWSVSPATAGTAASWQESLEAQVSQRSAPVFQAATDSSPVLCELAFGTRVPARSSKRGWTKVVLPGRRAGWVRKGCLDPVPCSAPTPAEIVAAARVFAGAPYLWGGVTPWGCDCSGLVQSVFRSCGMDLPRDARDQLGALQECLLDPCARRFKPGDLLFFGPRGKPVSHVAISVGGTRLMHAYGYVREGNLAEGSPSFLPELVPIFRAAARPLWAQKKG